MSCAPIYDTIVCFGDSLTSFAVPSGFVSKLQALYDRRLEVVCRGFSGFTTREASKIAPRLFVPTRSSSGRVVLTILWFGANDAAVEGHRQHNPLPKYISETKSIIETIHDSISSSSKANGSQLKTRILLLTPPPVYDNPSLIDSRNSETTKAYAEAIMGLNFEPHWGDVDSLEIVKMDVHSLFLEKAKEVKAGLKELLREDGLHISQKGYDVLYEAQIKTIRTSFPELDPISLPMVIPRWSVLDRETSSEALKEQLEKPSMDKA